MRTLKKQTLSKENLKNKTFDKMTDIDSPIPINVRDLNLPNKVSVTTSGEDIKNSKFWEEILKTKQ